MKSCKFFDQFSSTFVFRGIIILMCIISGVTNSTASPPPTVTNDLGDTFNLLWVDNFDTLDTIRWDASPDNISVIDGVLKLDVTKVSGQYVQSYLRTNTGYYINYNATQNTDYKYGRFEARMQTSGVAGLVPAFYIMHQEFEGATKEAWNEIDVESLSDPDKIDLTFWWSDERYAFPDLSKAYEQITTNFIPHADFHTYTIEWTPNYLTWLIDGTVVKRLSRSNCHGIKYLFFPSQIRFSHWRSGTVDDSKLPATMKIDYIACYELDAVKLIAKEDYSSKSATIVELTDYLGNLNHGDYVAFDDIATDNARNISVELSGGYQDERGIEIRKNIASGNLIAEQMASYTGDWGWYKNVSSTLSGAGSNEDVYFTFYGGSYVASLRNVCIWGENPTSFPLKYESEWGSIGGGAVVSNNTDASGDKSIGSLHTAGAYCEMNQLFVSEPDKYKLSIRYGSGESIPSIFTLYVNDVEIRDLTFVPTSGWNDFSGKVTTEIFLNGGGSDKIKLVSKYKGINLDFIYIEFSSRHEAESGTLSGNAAVFGNTPGASMHAVVHNLRSSSDSCLFNNVDGGGGGSKTLRLRYATGCIPYSRFSIYVNGVDNGVITLPPSAVNYNSALHNFSEVTATINLNAGSSNTIEIFGNFGWAFLDCIMIE